MELHIKERLLLPTTFPKTGSFMDYNLKKSILNKISVTEQDKTDYQIVADEKQQKIEWDLQKDMELPLSVEFTKEELAYMTRAFEAISEHPLDDDVWKVVERIYNEANTEK